MSDKKLESPIYIDMNTDEALARFIQTKPEVVLAAVSRKKRTARLEPDGEIVVKNPDRNRQRG